MFGFAIFVLFSHWTRCQADHSHSPTTPYRPAVHLSGKHSTSVTIGYGDYFEWDGDCSGFNAIVYYNGGRNCRCQVKLNVAGSIYYQYGSLLSSQHNLISCFYSDHGVGES